MIVVTMHRDCSFHSAHRAVRFRLIAKVGHETVTRVFFKGSLIRPNDVQHFAHEETQQGKNSILLCFVAAVDGRKPTDIQEEYRDSL